MEFLLSPIGIALTIGAFIGLIVSATNPHRGFAMMIFFGITAAMSSPNIAVLGFGTGLILVAIVPRILAERRILLPGQVFRRASPVDWMFFGIGIMSVVHLVVGIVKGNWFRFLLGDFYHLAVEIVLVFFVAQVLLRDERDIRRFLRVTGIGIACIAVVLLILMATGWIRAIPGSGWVMSHTDFWRYRYSHHFPLNPLLLYLGVVSVGKVRGGMRVYVFATLTLLVALVISLKRAAYLAFASVVIVLPFLLSPRNRARSAIFAAFCAVAIAIAVLVLPSDTWNPITKSFIIDRATSVTEGKHELGNREEQTRIAFSLLMKNPAGYGLGSRLETYRTDKTHYVHNSFLHHGLMAGLPTALLLLVIIVKTLFDGWRLYRRLPDGLFRGIVVGCLMGLVTVLETSFGEATVNTFFFPIFVALIYNIRSIDRSRQRDASGSMRSERWPAAFGA